MIFQQYLTDIFKTTQAGNVREESYYSDLKKLLESYALQNKKQINVTTLPKKTEAGNPDFRVQTDKYQLVGYIEAKVPTVENLDAIESSEQLKRYLSTFPNLILTNFLEFRLYRNGEMIDKVILGRSLILNQLGVIPPIENELYLQKLLSEFFSFNTPQITTAKTLAIELAKRTQFLKDNCIIEEQKEELVEGIQTLEGIFKLFKDYLISSLTLDDFSNLFSQTITFGLFAARLRSTSDFNRLNAFKTIPPTIGVLRSIFRFISSNDLPKNMEWVIDDIAELLKNTDVTKIVNNYYEKGKGNDPIIHFYETFLAEYDPKERAKRGVYYTSEPVVSYIVNSVHQLLKKKFKRPDGLASNSVTLLDPAAGTLTFPAEAIKVAIEEYKSRYGDGGVNSLIKNHIIPHFFAFELMMSPYVLGHIKASLILNEFNYHLGSHERFNLFLTNTLDLNAMPYMELPLFSDLSEESRQANDIKKNKKVMVVIGNPPYSVSSNNKIKEGSDFYKLYESYKEKVRKEEKNIQPLSNDYIKFIAFAHWKIKQTGQGIVAMITSNSYLDGLIHRNLREKLLNDFTEIYILNLHGNSNIQEKTPDGSKDENIFDIREGVSIVIMVKQIGKILNKVNYNDIFGTREEKYKYLNENNVENAKWKKINPESPQYFFTNKIFQNNSEYKKLVSLKDIFKKYSTGFTTGRDGFVTDINKNEVRQKIVTFTSNNTDYARTILNLKNNRDWSIEEAWGKTNTEGYKEEKLINYLYNPFDIRNIYFSSSLIDFPRLEIMGNMFYENLLLVTSKQYKPGKESFGTFCTNLVAGHKSVNAYDRNYCFPLYINNSQDGLEKTNKNNNLMWKNLPSYIQTIQPFTSKMSGNFFLPEKAIFFYIYAILYSNIYREKYKEFLKIDFPRIPFTENLEVFQSLASLGEELVNLHLLKSSQLDNPTTRFNGQGEGQVTKRKFDPETKRIYINDNQYFDNIESDIWSYYIGGYQVLDKWLKDRVGRTLSDEDVRHYCKVATALKLTKEVQARIDKIYMEVES